jgi:transcriptional regulator with XRE-family HTH domain
MSTRSSPALERRLLKDALRKARGGAGLTAKQVAEELGWSKSKLDRIEAGTVGVSQTDLRAMLFLYGVKDEGLVSSLIASARIARYLPWSAYKGIFGKSFLDYLDSEASASVMLDYEPLVVPGILQTEEYARTLLSQVSRFDGNDLERRVAARMSRQAILASGSGFSGSFLLDEAVLSRQVGGSGVQDAQIDRLLDLAAYATIEVRIMPFELGAYPDYGYPFVILEFEGPYEDLLFLEHPHGDVVTKNKPVLAASYKEKFHSTFSGAIDIRTFMSHGGTAMASQAAL